MFKRSEEIQRIDWAASQMKSRELPYTVLRGLMLKLVLTTTNGGAAALTALQVASVISDLRIKLNGADNRVSVSGELLYLMNYYDFSKAPESSIDTAVGTGKTQSVSLYLPFALTRAVRPEDSLLDLRKNPPLNPISTAYMEVTFPSASIGTDVTITSGYLYIQTLEYMLAPDRPFIAIHEMDYIQQTLSQTGKNRVMLDVGGTNEYRKFVILTKNSSGTLNNAQVDKITLRSRSTVFHEIDDALLQDANGAEYSITPQTGCYILELTTDGQMSGRLDAKKLDELVLELNSLVSNGTVVILKEKVFYFPQSA